MRPEEEDRPTNYVGACSRTDGTVQRWVWRRTKALYCSKLASIVRTVFEFWTGTVRYFDYHRRALTLTEWDQRRHGHDLWRVLDPQIPTTF